MSATAARLLLLALLSIDPARAWAAEPSPTGDTPAERIVSAVDDPFLKALAEETLARNPGLLASSAHARAMRLAAVGERALPDPTAEVMAFALPPETRVGPQRLTIGASQALPWAGKRALKEEVALRAADARENEAAAERVALVTRMRRHYYELLFLDRQLEITKIFREHLVQHEEVSQARYATGVGSAQAVIKLQAEITRIERDLLTLEARLVDAVARINRLRDRPAATPVERGALPARIEERQFDAAALIERARAQRRELHAAEARVERAKTLERLAERAFKPDFVVGLTYTLVDPRDDLAAGTMPPAGNGDDILAIRGGVRIPLWRDRLEAGVQQAVEMQLAAASAKRDLALSIESVIGDLSERLRLEWRQLRLVQDLLVVQAAETLESAQAGYIAGTLNALDLLDAEHILFDARTAVARAKTDYLVDLAELEGAVGEPLGWRE